jgi:proteasome lid subunit RPN8/RPN11/molybdopterin converting factor small subunit
MASLPTVRVRIPAVLRPLAGGRAQLSGVGATVGEVIRAASRDLPELRGRLLDDAGRLRRYVTFFLDGEDVRHAGGADAPVRDGGELTVVPALSGGAGEGPVAPEAHGRSPGSADETFPALAALAERSPRAEICGLVLAAPDGAPPEIVLLRNVAPDPARAFGADPRELLAALRAAEDRGRAVAAIFHSHLAGGAGLSHADLAELTAEGRPLWPGAEMWVVAVERGRAAEVRAHTFADRSYIERTRWSAPFTER